MFSHKSMSPCHLKYDLIIKQEVFGDEFGYIAGKILV